MKTPRLLNRFILFVGAFSLIGVIGTQMFWVRNAMGLQEEQCDHRVMVGLQLISSQIIAQDQYGFYLNAFYRTNPNDSSNLASIDPIRLDSLIMQKFCELNITREYYYGFVDLNDTIFVCGNYSGHEADILYSNLYTTIGHRTGGPFFILAVEFADSHVNMLSQILVWVIMSALFTLVLMLSFLSTVLAFFRQKRMSEIKTDFINNMTHEFKTPISTISVASEMLMRKNMNVNPEKSSKYAEIIYNENRRLETLVERVLQIAVLERGEYEVAIRTFDLHDVLQSRCDVISPSVHEKGGELITEFRATVSRIEGDEMHIVNVFSNLLDNAFKYSGEIPFIRVSTENVEQGIIVKVRDKGIGIPSETQRLVFKQFFRGQAGDLHDTKGFGIGLYYVKTIVEAHGGYIKLNSEPGEGSEFEVFLPFKVSTQQ